MHEAICVKSHNWSIQNFPTFLCIVWSISPSTKHSISRIQTKVKKHKHMCWHIQYKKASSLARSSLHDQFKLPWSTRNTTNHITPPYKYHIISLFLSPIHNNNQQEQDHNDDEVEKKRFDCFDDNVGGGVNDDEPCRRHKGSQGFIRHGLCKCQSPIICLRQGQGHHVLLARKTCLRSQP